MSFESLEDVTAWAEVNGGAAGLREAIEQGRLGSNKRSLRLAETWLSQHDEERKARRGAAIYEEERGLRQREIAAQESAAESAKRAVAEAKRAGDAAVRSARWTFAAAAISTLALVVSVVAYLKPPH